MTETIFNIILSTFFCMPLILWILFLIVEHTINKRLEKFEKEYDELRCKKFEEAIKIMKDN